MVNILKTPLGKRRESGLRILEQLAKMWRRMCGSAIIDEIYEELGLVKMMGATSE